VSALIKGALAGAPLQEKAFLTSMSATLSKSGAALQKNALALSPMMMMPAIEPPAMAPAQTVSWFSTPMR